MKKLKLFARQCTCCKKGMNEGYVISYIERYYCTEKCLRKENSDDDIKNMDMGADDSDNYWTQWDSDDDMEYMLVDGELVYIGEQ
jgi:hypothetical protein